MLCSVVNLTSQTDKNETILVLNSSRNGWKPAMLINIEGEQEELACFERDQNTEAHDACSIKWRNQMHIFGGFGMKRQISKLNGFKLEGIGRLSFGHKSGTCSVMNDQYIYLCFNSDDNKRCRQSTGPLETFSDVSLSNHDHRLTQTSCSDSKYHKSAIESKLL